MGRLDYTKLPNGVPNQVDLVRDTVGDVPVTGALCFVEADWPLIAGAFATRGISVLWPKRLSKMLTAQTRGHVDIRRHARKVASRHRAHPC
ncbi:hypothetical protein [Arthrobacter sp. MA-N2]|uniref:hypothetical protein n=1 Tax=Arthrobacter sp. MA-N2 TaxID=1101188 RepID=UPI0004B2E619|nr:hypothetical protein [Arthrobacter sp. MA-N2]